MPVENLEEESLAKNPNLELAQYLFLLTIDGNDVASKTRLLEAINENNMAPFYKQVMFFCFYLDYI